MQLAALALLALACESAPPAREIPPEGTTPAPPEASSLPLAALSPARTLADLTALSERAADACGDAEASSRAYLTEQLQRTGLTVQTLSTPEPSPATPGQAPRSFAHLIATAPGASSDLFVLVAPLAQRGAREGDAVGEGESGAALLLELARVQSTRSLPYTTRFVWLAGRDATGAEALAAQMAALGELQRVRLLVAIERVCRADLRIARDLGSQRVPREEFFDAAARTGRERFFPRNQDYETVESIHLAFRGAGVRPVVAVVSASSSPGAKAGDTCSAPSLDAVGAVTLDALDAIGRRLAKIDRFSRAPLITPAADTAATPSLATPESSAPPAPTSGETVNP